MKLTAVAVAFAVTLGVAVWASNRPAQDAPAQGHATQLSEQPLVGLGGGVTLRELSQDTPFSLVALTGDLAGTSTRVRAKRPDGSWGPWYQTDRDVSARFAAPGDGTAGDGGPRSTAPLFVGTTTAVQLAVTRPAGAPVTGMSQSAPLEPGASLGYAR